MVYSDFYNELVLWYNTYTSEFMGMDAEMDNAVTMKIEHTKRVCSEIDLLCESLNLNEKDCILSRIIALLHDIGRYEQYKNYRTFSDHKSVNHADLALSVLDYHKIMKEIPGEDADMVRTAVLFHNARQVPCTLNEKEQLFCKLIRDADKLDIYRIAVNYYTKPDLLKKNFLKEDSFYDTAISPEVCQGVYDGQFVEYEKIKTLNDFKLIQIGWVYDLNFPASFKLLKERKYFLYIKNQLSLIPDSHEFQAVNKAEHFLEENAH
jgi:hypothetical protein